MTALARIFRTEILTVAMKDGANALSEDEALRARYVVLSGTLTADASVILPRREGTDWIVVNATSGGYAVTLRGTTGLGVVVVPGGTTAVVDDGTNFRRSSARPAGVELVAVANSASPTTISDAQAQARMLGLTGALTATRTAQLPVEAGADWIFANLTTGGQVVRIQAPSGSYVDIGPGEVLHLASPGVGLTQVATSPNASESTVCLVDVGVTNAATVALTAKQSRAQVVWLVGTMDGAGVELTFASGKSDNARTTIINGTDYAITIPGVTSGAEQIPAGTSRTYTWSAGGLVESGERSMSERAAGRVVSISTAGATTYCPDLEVGNGIAITKNGAGDYTVNYTAVVGMSVIRGAQCTPLGATPVSSAVELVSSYVVRVRLSADAPFTLSVL